MDSWYYLNQGASVGPLTRQAMEAMIRAGTLRADTMVWPGFGDWVPASSSSLGPVFSGGAAPAGYAPPPPAGYNPGAMAPAKKDWLPQDKTTRTVVLAAITLIGLYMIWGGLQQVGLFSRDNPDARINIVGCQATGPSAMQCGFQNIGMVAGRACFDLVILCFDGRHVASACSDRMQPGESSQREVTGFKPTIQPTMQCSGGSIENARAKT